MHTSARRLLWQAAALVFFSGLAVATALNFAWHQAHDAGEALSRTYARIVQEQTDRALQSVDQRLQLATAGMDQLKLTGKLNEANANALLKAQIVNLPYVRSLWVMNAGGDVIYSSLDNYKGNNLAQRDYFQFHLNRDDSGVYVGAPVIGVVTKKWLISMSRPLRNADGSFAGVVVAGLESGYFEALWRELSLGQGGSVSLFRSDSVLMIRSPALETATGKTFPTLPYFMMPPQKRQEGVLDSASPLDGVHRQYAYRKLALFPAVVVVGMTHQSILAQWNKMAAIVLTLWALGCMVTTLLSLHLARDINLRLQTEEALNNSDRRWQFALEGAGDGIWDWDVSSGTVFYSPRWCEMLGYDTTEIGNTSEEWVSRIHPDDRVNAASEMEALAAGRIPFFIKEHRVRCKDGSYKWILGRGMVVERTPSGKALRVVGTNSDITERKLDQESIKAALAEKTALLNEVHHRVKNNLQVVTSLLRLEAGRSAQSDTKAVLLEMQGRVRSMALLHESLYRTGIFASVDLAAYLKNLATQAFRAMSAPAGNIRLVLDLAPVSVSMDLATPCGLLVNELISNCLKHAFVGVDSGEVRLALQPVPDSGLVRLRISDTGRGLPDDFEERRESSLGLHLATDLARQMGGHLDIGPGATFEVEFPVEVQKSMPAPLG